MKRRTFLATIAGLAAVRPAFAQSTRQIRIGFFAQGTAIGARKMLLAALRDRGWSEGNNIVLEAIAGGGDPARWDAAAQSLLDKHCDLIVVLGSHMTLVMKRVAPTTPLVMMMSGYPVEAGIVPSLAHPGGTITGLRTYTDELPGKLVELARELVPTLCLLGVLDNYAPPLFVPGEVEAGKRARERAAKALNVELREWKILGDADLTRALAEAEAIGVDALLAFSGPTNSQPRNEARIREYLRRRRLPMLTDVAGSLFREGGAIATYSANWNEIAERTAHFVDRILKGARPAELPIEQPTQFDLIVNQKNAEAIGLRVSPALLARADRVIE